MFHLSDSPVMKPMQPPSRARTSSIAKTDVEMFKRIWNQDVVQDWILDKSRLQPWLEIGIFCSILLSLLLLINICIWATTDKVGSFWILPLIHWILVGPFWTTRFFMDFEENKDLICRWFFLSPLWCDFFGVPTARVYFQEQNEFPCSLYRLETEFKTYPTILFLLCGVSIHNETAILEGFCIFLCLMVIMCERLLLMRVARYPTDFFVDIMNGVETFSDCYLRTSSVVLFAYSQGDVSLLHIVLPITLYMFSTVCALAILLEQRDKRTITASKFRSLFKLSLYYAIPGMFAGYNFSVHLQHAKDRTRKVEHLKSVVIEAITRFLMSLMFTSFAMENLDARDTWNAFFWTAVAFFFASTVVRFIEVNIQRRRDKKRADSITLEEEERLSRRPSSAKMVRFYDETFMPPTIGKVEHEGMLFNAALFPTAGGYSATVMESEQAMESDVVGLHLYNIPSEKVRTSHV